MKEQRVAHTVHTVAFLKERYLVHGRSVVMIIQEQTAEIHIKGMAVDRGQRQQGKAIDPGYENNQY